MVFSFTAKFLQKLAYGYDVGGEVYEGSGPIAEEINLRDTQEPQDHHETPHRSLVNMVTDNEAKEQFPELQGRGEQRLLPPRKK